MGGRADADQGALPAGRRAWAAILGGRPSGARRDAGRLLPDHRLQPQIRDQHPARSQADAALAAQASASPLWQGLPGRPGRSLGGRRLHLRRALTSLPARPAAAAREAPPALAGAGDPGLAARRQYLPHLSQPGSAPARGALAATQPATAQPPTGRSSDPGAPLASRGTAWLPGGRSRLAQRPLGDWGVDLHALGDRPGDRLERTGAGDDQEPAGGPGRLCSSPSAAALSPLGPAHRQRRRVPERSPGRLLPSSSDSAQSRPPLPWQRQPPHRAEERIPGASAAGQPAPGQRRAAGLAGPALQRLPAAFQQLLPARDAADRSSSGRRALAAAPRHPSDPLQRLLETGAAEPTKHSELVKLYTSVSPLSLKHSIDRHLRTMPADHYSSPTQRSMVAADA